MRVREWEFSRAGPVSLLGEEARKGGPPVPVGVSYLIPVECTLARDTSGLRDIIQESGSLELPSCEQGKCGVLIKGERVYYLDLYSP
jgi:hypothetical protein